MGIRARRPLKRGNGFGVNAREMMRKQILWSMAGVVAAIAAVSVLICLRDEGRERTLGIELGRRVESFSVRRQKLAVVRPAFDGSAFEAQLKALDGVFPRGVESAATLKELLGVPEILVRKAELAAEVTRLMESSPAAWQSLRDSTHGTWTPYRFERQERRGLASWPMESQAAEMVLVAQASRSPLPACLEICTDVVRLVAATPVADLAVERYSMANHAIRAALETMLACAARASKDDLTRTSGELAQVIDALPSIGAALEWSTLSSAVNVSEFSEGARIPFGLTGLKVLVQRHAMLKGWESWTRAPERWSRVASATYPGASIALEQEISSRGVPRVPLSHDLPWKQLHEIAIGSLESLPDQQRAILRGHWTALAYLRAGRAALSAFGKREAGQPFGAVSSDRGDPSLRDPFGDAPFRWLQNDDGSGWTIRSRGPNGKDDAGQSESDDIVLRFPTTPG